MLILIVEDNIKLYEEPKFDEDGNLIKDSLSEEERNRRLQISLKNDILITNCGVPLIFVVNKSDNPCPKYEEKSEFILRHIRKMAINYGATIIYTSTKKKYNLKILYDYIFYTLFNFDFIHKLNMNDKNSYFIPSGYDRFSLLKNNDKQHDIDVEYSDMIKNEEIIINSNISKEEEVSCEKVSDYLKKIKERILKSRKSVLRDNFNFQKLKEPEQKKNEDTTEKVNKFDKFMKKKEPEVPSTKVEEKHTLTKEERTKLTRENIMNKLKVKNNNKK